MTVEALGVAMNDKAAYPATATSSLRRVVTSGLRVLLDAADTPSRLTAPCLAFLCLGDAGHCLFFLPTLLLVAMSV